MDIFKLGDKILALLEAMFGFCNAWTIARQF